jgi:hypothetical protein
MDQKMCQDQKRTESRNWQIAETGNGQRPETDKEQKLTKARRQKGQKQTKARNWQRPQKNLQRTETATGQKRTEARNWPRPETKKGQKLIKARKWQRPETATSQIRTKARHWQRPETDKKPETDRGHKKHSPALSFCKSIFLVRGIRGE